MISILIDDTTYVLSNPPNLEGLPNYELLQAKYDRGEFTEIPEIAAILPPDWDGLLNRLLSADLYPLFRAITVAAASNPVIFMARQDIYGALSNPAISDRLSALRAGLDILLSSGYALSDEHRDLWNVAIAELNFPDEVKL
jgi:hypothetical protein